jgi:hypothetical protein
MVSIGTILLTGLFLAGCNSAVTGMKGMKEGTGPAEDPSVKNKTGAVIKEFPPLPPDAEVPPMKTK